MRRILSCLLALALLCGLAPAAGAGSAAPRSLTVLGDSIAQGFTLSEGILANNYGAQLARAFSLKVGESYANLALAGKTSTQLLKDIREKKDVRARLRKSECVVISIGANDVLGLVVRLLQERYGEIESLEALFLYMREYPQELLDFCALLEQNESAFQSAIAGFSANLTKITAAIRALNPEAEIYLTTVYNPLSGIGYLRPLADFADQWLFAPLNAAMGKQAANGDFVLVDVFPRFAGKAPTLMMPYDIHPSQAGHNLFFQALYPAICASPPAPTRVVRLSQKQLALAAGDTAALTAAAKPAGAQIVWTSSNERVATVAGGAVKALRAGTATIRAAAKDNAAVFAECRLTVAGAPDRAVGFGAQVRNAPGPKARGQIRLTFSGGGGRYDVSLNGGKTWPYANLGASRTIADCKIGDYVIVVRDSADHANRAEKTVRVTAKLDAPIVTRAKRYAHSILLKWSGNAPAYEIWRAEAGSKSFRLIGIAATRQYIDGGLARRTAYSYKIRAIGADGAYSRFSPPVSRTSKYWEEIA